MTGARDPRDSHRRSKSHSRYRIRSPMDRSRNHRDSRDALGDSSEYRQTRDERREREDFIAQRDTSRNHRTREGSPDRRGRRNQEPSESGDSDDESSLEDEETSLIPKTTHKAQIYATGFKFLGGPGNLHNRQAKPISDVLAKNIEILQPMINKAIRDWGYGNQDAVLSLFTGFVQNNLYISRSAVKKAFPTDYKILQTECPIDDREKFEMPEYDLPSPCRIFICGALNERCGDNTFKFLKDKLNIDVVEYGIQAGFMVGISSKRVQRWLNSADCIAYLTDRPGGFRESEWKRVLRRCTKISDNVYHPGTPVTITYLIEATQAVIDLITLFGWGVSPDTMQLKYLQKLLRDWIKWSEQNQNSSHDELLALLEPAVQRHEAAATADFRLLYEDRVFNDAKNYFTGLILDKRSRERMALGDALINHLEGLVAGRAQPVFVFPEYVRGMA